MMFTGTFLSGCYDDSYIKEQLDDYGNRLSKLEAVCQEQNKNISSLKAIVDALGQNDFVTGIAPIEKNGVVVGYTISFHKSSNIDIFHGKDGTSGVDGKDGYTPIVGLNKDVDGNYYWTIDGEWLLCDGQKIQANGIDGKPGTDGKDGITPQLKIQNGMWYISFDNGVTWEPDPLGPATGTPGQNGDSIFSKISYDDKFIYLTLSDGVTTLTLPRSANGQGVGPVTISLDKVTSNSAIFNGNINATDTNLDYIQIIIRYSTLELFSAVDESLPCTIINKPDLTPDKNFTAAITDLKAGTTYKYCIIVQNRNDKEYGDVLTFTTAVNDSTQGGGQGGNENTPSFINNTVWTYGIAGIPAPDTWEIVDTYGYTQFGLKWDASYGWYDCNKTDPYGNIDSKLCWAASASNMIHWWLRFNSDNITRYGKYTGPIGYTTSTDENIFYFFKSAFFNNGNPVHFGLNWFFTGLNQFVGDFNMPQDDVTAGFFAEILGVNTNICEYYQFPSISLLTEKIKDAFSNKKCISLVHDYAGIPHAINLWGADFDSNGNITTIYITDNNDIDLESNKAPKTPAGLLKRAVKEVNGKMCMANWQGDCHIEIQGITLLSLMTDKWNTYFATHP